MVFYKPLGFIAYVCNRLLPLGMHLSIPGHILFQFYSLVLYNRYMHYLHDLLKDGRFCFTMFRN